MSDACPHCSGPTLTSDNGKCRTRFCPACYREIDPEMKPVALKIPGLDPGPQRRRVKELEYRIVKQLYEALRNRGYTVVRLGQRNARLGGNDAGAPDIIYTRPTFGAVWGALEVKSDAGNHSGRPEQEEFAELGLTHVVRSVAHGLAIAEATRARLEGLVRG